MVALQQKNKFTLSTERRQVERVYKRGSLSHKGHGEKRLGIDLVNLIQ